MDEAGNKKFQEDISELEDGLYQAEDITGIRNCIIQHLQLTKTLHADIEAAHMRIDHRKDELKVIRKSLDALTEKMGVMSDKVTRLAETQEGLIKLFNKNITAMNRQMEEQKKNSKRISAFIVAISLISLIGTFGSIKGASIATSIWNVLSKLI